MPLILKETNFIAKLSIDTESVNAEMVPLKAFIKQICLSEKVHELFAFQQAVVSVYTIN